VVVGLMCKRTAPEWVQHQRGRLRIHTSQPKGWNSLLASSLGVFVCAKRNAPRQELDVAWKSASHLRKSVFLKCMFKQMWDLDVWLHTCSTE
jgi:hypothetical protein